MGLQTLAIRPLPPIRARLPLPRRAPSFLPPRIRRFRAPCLGHAHEYAAQSPSSSISFDGACDWGIDGVDDVRVPLVESDSQGEAFAPDSGDPGSSLEEPGDGGTGAVPHIWRQMKEIAVFAGPAVGLWICGPLMSLIDTAVIGQGSSLELAALDGTSVAMVMPGQIGQCFGPRALKAVIAAFMMIETLNRTGFKAFSLTIPSPDELLLIIGIAAPVFITMTSKARMLLQSLVIIGAISGLSLGVIGTSVPWFLPKLFTTDRNVISEMPQMLREGAFDQVLQGSSSLLEVWLLGPLKPCLQELRGEEGGGQEEVGVRASVILRGIPLLWRTTEVIRGLVRNFGHLLEVTELGVSGEAFPVVKTLVWLERGSAVPTRLEVVLDCWKVMVGVELEGGGRLGLSGGWREAGVDNEEREAIRVAKGKTPVRAYELNSVSPAGRVLGDSGYKKVVGCDVAVDRDVSPIGVAATGQGQKQGMEVAPILEFEGMGEA
ncbi:hypothetical protein QJS10_CPB11g00913 [Acorus calamus]|uniref:Uncharacterized protein n=1 Tax=Acorus calamus TaxID=4465 RepID=A0AAV9DRD3_ACOCL|nr:hypothetical protein QJS10_CPB11g00913 [Acorus calamus]